MNTHAVLKFGGSSLGTAESIQNAGDRVEEARREGPTVAVVSAARPPDTEGTTNRLLRLFDTAKSGRPTSDQFDELLEMHLSLVNELGLSTDPLTESGQELLANLRRVSGGDSSPKQLDTIQTWGERTQYKAIFQPHLAERGIPSVAVDSADLITTNSNFGNANVDEQISYSRMQAELLPHLEKNIVPVVPGFYGTDVDRNIVAFSRGGSDFTGALVAAGLRANHIDICTDTEGVLQVDPKRIPGTQYINRLSYWEMLVFARRGASVVHKNAVGPIMGNGVPGIPMRVVNTANGVSRTTVSDDAEEGPKAIGIKDAQTFLSIRDQRMEDAGILGGITKLLADNGLSIDVLSSETPTIEMTVDGEIPEVVRGQLESQFHSCNIQKDSSTVVLVGHNVRRNREAVHALVDISEPHRHALTEGPDSMTIVVPQNVSDSVMRELYDAILASKG